MNPCLFKCHVIGIALVPNYVCLGCVCVCVRRGGGEGMGEGDHRPPSPVICS